VLAHRCTSQRIWFTRFKQGRKPIDLCGSFGGITSTLGLLRIFGKGRGRDEIDRIAGAIKATHPEFRYQPITEPAESGNGGLVRWVSGRPGEAPAYAGTDFIIARDGRIAAVYLFFDKLP
jgi:hypothetical protein